MNVESKDQGIKNEFGNTNSRDIWQNKLLCAQFLRGYARVSLLEHVQPEDIEDITEALRPFVGVEYEGDSVKQIHLREMEDRDVFVVGLLEHKSDVDYDVTFQLLKYMVGIWTMHRNRKNKEKTDCSRSKEFRYPLIIPIVYYEGERNWTADMYWRDRVEFSDILGKYVPDFTYEVVGLHSYSNEELLSREEELSLVMMLNRVQTENDLDFGEWPEEQRAIVEKIVHRAPQDVLRILAQMVYHFGLKLNLTDEKLHKYVKNVVKEQDMGELWAHMEDINLPKRMRELDEQKRELDERAQGLAERKQELDERAQGLAERKQELAEQAQGLAEMEQALKRRAQDLQEQENQMQKQANQMQEQADRVQKQADRMKKEAWREAREEAQREVQTAIAERDRRIAELLAENERLRK